MLRDSWLGDLRPKRCQLCNHVPSRARSHGAYTGEKMSTTKDGPEKNQLQLECFEPNSVRETRWGEGMQKKICTRLGFARWNSHFARKEAGCSKLMGQTNIGLD